MKTFLLVSTCLCFGGTSGDSSTDQANAQFNSSKLNVTSGNCVSANHSLLIAKSCISNITYLPVYVETAVLDNKTVSHYDSDSQRTVPTPPFEDMDQEYWDSSTEESKATEGRLQNDLPGLKKSKNLPGNVHVLQEVIVCCWNSETNITNSDTTYFLDGERTGSPDGSPLETFNEELCISRLKMYVQQQNRIAKPMVAVFYNDFKSSVVCEVKGFYPKPLKITWMMDGVDLKENVIMGETLFSKNSLFQKSAILTVMPEQSENKQLTCRVSHKTGVIWEDITVETPSTYKVGLIASNVVWALLCCAICWLTWRGCRMFDGVRCPRCPMELSVVPGVPGEDEHAPLAQAPGKAPPPAS